MIAIHRQVSCCVRLDQPFRLMTSFNYSKWDNIELSDDEVSIVINKFCSRNQW